MKFRTVSEQDNKAAQIVAEDRTSTMEVDRDEGENVIL